MDTLSSVLAVAVSAAVIITSLMYLEVLLLSRDIRTSLAHLKEIILRGGG